MESRKVHWERKLMSKGGICCEKDFSDTHNNLKMSHDSGKMKNPKPMRKIQNMSGLFPLSSLLGLMPCAEDDAVNKKLVLYTVLLHVAYRLVNLAVLGYFLMVTKTSMSLFSLLVIVTVMKALCVTVHDIVVIKNRLRFLKLAENCRESDFFSNPYRKQTIYVLLFLIYLYIIAQFAQKRWVAVFRDIFSMLDVAIPILIIMQFCTFLKIAQSKFKNSRLRLLAYFYQTCDIVEEHLHNLELVEILQDLYTQQMFFCVCFLGFDFFVSSYDFLERLLSSQRFISVISPMSYFTLCLTSIWILARACEDTTKEAEKFDLKLFLLMNDSQALRKNPELQLYLKRKVPVNFTGGHFFNLGYPLVTSIAAATTTYLIFLIQFRSD